MTIEFPYKPTDEIYFLCPISLKIKREQIVEVHSKTVSVSVTVANSGRRTEFSYRVTHHEGLLLSSQVYKNRQTLIDNL